MYQRITSYLNKYFFRIWIICMAGMLMLFYLLSSRNQKRILKNQKYTVGIITREFHYKKTGKPSGKDYEYKVRGIKYEKTISGIITEIGSRYLIIYDSLRPNRGCLLRDYEIKKLNLNTKMMVGNPMKFQ